MNRIPLFRRLEIETQSTCNRVCPTCIRNSNPDKDVVAPWFERNQLESEHIDRILNEAVAMGFRGEVCLSHYNEPLMDERIVDIVQKTKAMGFSRVFMCSNADYLTDKMAIGLDGHLDDIGITLYMNDPIRAKRDEWIRTLFKKTKLTLSHGHDRMITHDSPLVDAASMARKHENNPCFQPLVRMIINHRGQMLLCCDDMVGNFNLGTIFEKSIDELWNSELHTNYVIELQKRGGRKVHNHCLTCPRK